VAVLIAGFVLVLAGIAMLVLPGPGLLVIFLGCVVLATEFVWAHHVLRRGLAVVPARWRSGIERTIAPAKAPDPDIAQPGG